MTIDGLDWLFRSHGVLANRIVSITREDAIDRCEWDGTKESWPLVNERGKQIADWLANHLNVDRYVVIDDMDLGISEAGHPFVHVDGTVGLTDRDAVKAIGILNGGVS